MTPGISVIIPAYKARKYLPECLESIGLQTLRPAEILVIDDASPEPIDDIVSSFAARPSYPPIRLIKHEVNRGQAAGRNTGMNASTSEWLAFLDCDDMWAPTHLESVMCAIHESGADLGFCPAILFNYDVHDPQNYRLRPLTPDEQTITPLSLLNRCFIITSSVVLRSTTLGGVGGFDESPSMRGTEDLDFFMKLLRAGTRFQMVPEATLYYRKHPDSATGTMGYLARQDVYVKERHIDWPAGSRSEKQIIMIEAYWRAAIGLWISKAPDRMAWLFSALRHSLWNPFQCLRWTYRFFRALRRDSAAGL